jgi:pimeloyl-ACP methyl ester carboxylesterase
MPMRGVEIGGVRLAYVERGSGEPVVFVHGVLNELRSWGHQLDAVGAGYRSVALSCRHYFPNEPMPEAGRQPVELLVDDLAGFLGALELPMPGVSVPPRPFEVLRLLARQPRAARQFYDSARPAWARPCEPWPAVTTSAAWICSSLPCSAAKRRRR